MNSPLAAPGIIQKGFRMEKLENIISSSIDHANIVDGIFNIEIELPPFNVPEAFLFGPKSRLTDKWVPIVEKIVLPSTSTVRGKLSILVNANSIEKVNYSDEYLQVGKNSKDQQARMTCDMRMHFPQNWAHTLTNHIPMAKIVTNVAKRLNLPPVIFILPKKLPQYCKDAFSIFGLEIVTSDKVFTENNITIKCDPWIAIRGIRHMIAEQYANLLSSIVAGTSISEKIYISRRDTRSILNENELFMYLDDLGFKRIYPEDYSVLEQLSLFRYAHNVVAISGAGLAPILWGKSDENRKIVELFQPSNMTNVWRVVAEQKKWKWVGVRGKLWPSFCKHIYGEQKNPNKYAFKNFEVCLDSVASAIYSVGM